VKIHPALIRLSRFFFLLHSKSFAEHFFLIAAPGVPVANGINK
jgi:hypothetical protein